MKLLILTQKVDQEDDVLGFFHAWIKEFASHYDEVIVIALSVGMYELPPNVKVLSLGKEEGVSRITYVLRFIRYIVQYRRHYDAVFVHMNTEYVVLGGLLWKFMDKKISLWYTHRQVTWKLRVALVLSNMVFTAAKESLNLISPKIRIVGHGIEVEKFICDEKPSASPLRILHMGRITRIKNCDTLIAAGILLKKRGIPVELRFAGETITPDDAIYKQELLSLIIKNNLGSSVQFFPVKNQMLRETFADADVTVNLTPTGGIDKAVLSGLVAKRPTFMSNTAFAGILGSYAPRLIFSYRDPEDLSAKILAFLSSPDRSRVLHELSDNVQKNYSVAHVITEIVREMGN